GLALGHLRQLGDELSRALACAERQADLPHALAARAALVAQPLEALHAAFVPRSARLDSFSYPRFFFGPEFVEPALRDGFGCKLLRFLLLPRGEVAWEGIQPAAVELDDARREAVEERAVVGDDDRRRLAREQAFQS